MKVACGCSIHTLTLAYSLVQEAQLMLTNPRDASVKVTEHGTIRYVMYGFLLVFYIKFVPKTSVLRYSTSKNVVTLKSGQRSLKVIGTGTARSATYEFVLTFHSNHEPISYRFRDKRRLQLKIANFSYPRVLCALADVVSP